MSDLPPSGRTEGDAIVPSDDDVVAPEDLEAVALAKLIRDFNPTTSGQLKADRKKRESMKKEEEDEPTQDFAALRDWAQEAEAEQEAFKIVGEIVDLTEEDENPPPRRCVWSPPRIPPAPGIEIKTEGSIAAPHLGPDQELKVNSLYEIEDPKKYVKIEFIKVTSFRKYAPGLPWVVIGLPHGRTRNLMGQLPRKTNELFALYETVDEIPRPTNEQALIEIPLSSVLAARHFHITNAPYPRHRFENYLYRNVEEVEKQGPLICRWKFTVRFHKFVNRIEGKPCEWELRRITADEVEKNRFREDEETLRHDWRGKTYRGGSHNPRGITVNRPDAAHADELRTRGIDQRYSFFDAFCGAGGASRGAERAGMEIKYGVDMWDKAAASWKLNFPNGEMFEADISDFMIATKDREIRVDCLHLSPPCQVWSPAHTIPGQNDERNIMALFACRTLIEKVRPRIITLEQTFGILNPMFKKFFDALVLSFTDYGYSVGWKVINCANYGLPQRRTRLVMIASCPGEALPGFPPVTHSSSGDDGLQKYTSIFQALAKLTPEVARSDPHHQPKYKRAPRDAVIGDPHQILPRCMTTSGGQNYHYSGERCYTNREFACLQGFPVWHKFSGSYVKKQIGNAFPPVVVQALYEHIQKCLHERDGFQGDWRPRLRTHNAIDVEELEERKARRRHRAAGGTAENAIEIGEDVVMAERCASRESSRTLSGNEAPAAHGGAYDPIMLD